MERSGAQGTIQIPDQVVVMFQLCALAVHGVCLSMSPTAVTVVSIIAGILIFIYVMQPKQNDDEDTAEPMEVDRSSSDNLFKPELPEKPVEVKSRTAKATPKATMTTLAVRADPEIYDDEIMGDGPIMLGD
eukprot:4101628-Pyramimonas_sp.AAC.1